MAAHRRGEAARPRSKSALSPHASAHHGALTSPQVKQPARDRYLLTVQILPTALLSRATSPTLRATSPTLRATSPVHSPVHSPGATKHRGFGSAASSTDESVEPLAEAAVEAVNELMRLMTGEVGKTNSFEPEVMTLIASDDLDC